MKKKTYNILMIVLLLIIICSTVNIYFLNFHNTLGYKPYTYADFDFSVNKSNITQDEAIELVNELMSVNYSLSFTDDFENGKLGKSSAMLRKVYLSENLTGWRILEILTHELVHLKYYTNNERFTTFTTFKILYESNNAMFVEKAKEIAINHCTDGGYRNTDYDCSYYINEYLKEVSK